MTLWSILGTLACEWVKVRFGLLSNRTLVPIEHIRAHPRRPATCALTKSFTSGVRHLFMTATWMPPPDIGSSVLRRRGLVLDVAYAGRRTTRPEF